MTNKRFTLRDYYNALLQIDAVKDNPTLREITEGRLVQLDKKNGTAAGDRKPTATQVANEGIKAEILEYMPTEGGLTVGEMIKEIPVCNGLSSSKVTALIHQLVKAELVIRSEVKGKAYFRKA